MSLPTRPDGTAHVVDAIAAAALSVPGVTSLHAGAYGEIGSHLPGRRVPGVRVGPQLTEVHVVLRHGVSIPIVTAAVRSLVRPLVETPVDVVVEDLDPS